GQSPFSKTLLLPQYMLYIYHYGKALQHPESSHHRGHFADDPPALDCCRKDKSTQAPNPQWTRCPALEQRRFGPAPQSQASDLQKRPWTEEGQEMRQGQIRVALYARVSTSNNGQDPQLQLRELREYAAHRGWKIASEYVDTGISGTREKRPELDR